MSLKKLGTLCLLGALGLFGIYFTCAASAVAEELTASYSNSNVTDLTVCKHNGGTVECLQDLFESLCAEAAAGDTININIAAGSYREQIFTMCDKPVNVRLIGAGIGETKFIANNIPDNFKTIYHSIESDRQFGPMIICSRAYLRSDPSGHSPSNPEAGNRCNASFSPSQFATTQFKELCLEMDRVVGDFIPYETFCQVRNLSIEGVGPPSAATDIIAGPGTPTLGFSAHWNRAEVSDIEVGGFYSQAMAVSNGHNPDLHHLTVRCALKVNPNGSPTPGIAINIAPPSTGTFFLDNPASGINIQHVEVSNCGTGIDLSQQVEGTVTHNNISDCSRGISLLGGKDFEFTHNRIVRSEANLSAAPGWGLGLTNVKDSLVLHNQFETNAVAVRLRPTITVPGFGASSGILVGHNLVFGNGPFLLDETTATPGDPHIEKKTVAPNKGSNH